MFARILGLQNFLVQGTENRNHLEKREISRGGVTFYELNKEI